ncbi:hypothetical protein F4782DRAFT_451833 [Xylaria castorea]|nr:hypothetical protein F4782DRAFT_451833 [Xylaria castorea]
MRSIFALTDHVCWLSPAADDSDAAFQMLKRIVQEVEDSEFAMDVIEPISGPIRFSTPEAKETHLALCEKLINYEELMPKDEGRSQGAAVLEKLLHRPFFSRVWIIQEFSLAKHCQLICGQNSLDAHAFEIAIKAIGLAASYHRTLSPEMSPRNNIFLFPFNWQYMRSKPVVVRQAIAFGSPPDLCDIILIYGECPKRPIYAASDPRDIVFGVLGCAADAESLGLQADYSKPVNQVFTQVTKAFIEQRKRYKLGPCSFLKDMQRLPSWVPDWKHLGELGGILYPINCSVPFAADDGLLDAPNDVGLGDWKILCTCGWYVDVVTAVMKPAQSRLIDPYFPPFLSPENQMHWLLEIIEFFQLDSWGQVDEVVVWRTVVQDQ